MSDPDRLGAIIITPIFVVAGIAMMVGAAKRVWLFWRSRRWPHTTAVITRSEVCEEPGGDGPDVFAPHVEYSFKVDGQNVNAKSVLFGLTGETFFTRPEAVQRANMFPVGATVSVWYDPARPTRCVLERKIERGMLGVFIGGALFTIVGGSFLLEAIFGR